MLAQIASRIDKKTSLNALGRVLAASGGNGTSSAQGYSTSIRPDETSHPIDDSSKGPTGVLDVPKRYLMGPGPANSYERILVR
jgi:hypothetical protein